MRNDKQSSFRQRLRQGASNFEFNALIEGVSTLDEPELEIEASARKPIEALLAPEPCDEVAPAPLEPAMAMPAPGTVAAAIAPDRLQGALESLAGRLTTDASRMRAALARGDVEDAGFCLAHVNQVLELLGDLDPTGETARRLEIADSPPPGQPWPATAWSVSEFARSPLSGLLPSGAGDRTVRALLYAAWGVTLDPSPPHR